MKKLFKVLRFFRIVNTRNELSITNILVLAFSIKFLLLPSTDFSNMSSVFCALVPILTSAGMYVSKNYMHSRFKGSAKIDNPD